MQKKLNTLISSRWIIPIEPHGLALENHALAIQDGRILDLLPKQEAIQKYQASETLDLKNHVLIPGFVNTHTHAAMNLLKGIANDIPLMKWLNEYIWPTEEKWIDESFVRDGTQLAMAEMIKCGTTCFNEMYFLPEAAAKAAHDAQMRALISLALIDITEKDIKKAFATYREKCIALHGIYKNDPLVSIELGPHAPYTVSDYSLKEIKKLADNLKLHIHMHVHETKHEVDESLEKLKKRPLKRLEELELLDKNFQAIHMTQVTDEDIKLIQTHNCHIVHCPESNLKLASGFCPVQKLLNSNINVALGTDGAVSNNDLDIISEMRTASLLAKAVSGDAAALTAANALRMATLNGAKAMGLEKEIGSLEIGKSADLTAIDLSDISTQPIYDPTAQIVYAANRHQVTDVWVAGYRLLKNRQLTTLDEKEIIAKANEWADKIKKT